MKSRVTARIIFRPFKNFRHCIVLTMANRPVGGVAKLRDNAIGAGGLVLEVLAREVSLAVRYRCGVSSEMCYPDGRHAHFTINLKN